MGVHGGGSPGASAKCAHQCVTADYGVQLSVARLCYHMAGVKDSGG